MFIKRHVVLLRRWRLDAVLGRAPFNRVSRWIASSILTRVFGGGSASRQDIDTASMTIVVTCKKTNPRPILLPGYGGWSPMRRPDARRTERLRSGDTLIGRFVNGTGNQKWLT